MSYSKHVTAKAVTITWSDGTSKTIASSDPNYAKALDGFRQKLNEAKLRSKLDAMVTVASWSGGSIVENSGAMYANTPAGLMEVPAELADTLKEWIKNDWPAQAFARFVYRLLQNSSKRSIATFYGFVKNYGLTITDEGMVRGYKAINWDWTDKYTGKVPNHIGAQPVMHRNLVDDDPDHGCSVGSK